MTQPSLIRSNWTAQDRKAKIKDRLVGLELRQKARAERRRRVSAYLIAKREGRDPGPYPKQLELP